MNNQQEHILAHAACKKVLSRKFPIDLGAINLVGMKLFDLSKDGNNNPVIKAPAIRLAIQVTTIPKKNFISI